MGSVAACLTTTTGKPNVVRRMLGAAPHRGTTHATVEVGSVVVGSATGEDYPDASLYGRGDWAAALAGRLDNLSDLITALGHTGHEFYPDASPAQVVLDAFLAWGHDAWPRLRGEFAVVLSDGQNLWAVRDQLGAATLFYRHANDAAYVASEAKQVAVGAGIPRTADLDAIQQLFFGSEDIDAEPPAAIVGVERVPRAHVVTFQDGNTPRRHRYWDPSDLVATARLSAAEAQERLLILIRQAAERALSGADVLALSGGIDSPAIAAFAASAHQRMTGEPLTALSSVYPHAPSVDETRYIRMVVEALGMNWHSYVPEFRQLHDLDVWVDRFDGPVPIVDIPAVAEFFGHVRRLGKRTAIFGELAELTIDLAQHIEGELILRGRWPTAARRLSAIHARGSTWPGALRSVLPSLTPSGIATWYVMRREDGNKYLADWIDPALVPGLHRRWDLERPVRSRWADLQAYFAIAPSNIGVEATSIVASHFGVEMRRPLVDVDLWEFLLSLPAHVKYPGPLRKSLLRNALRGHVPDPILDRSDKTVFNEDILQRSNLPALRHWILGTDFRMKGIDYARVAAHLDADDLPIWEQNALNFLASVHAFVSVVA